MKVILIALMLLTTTTTFAQTHIEATAGWSPPTYGTPVEHYILQHSVNGGECYSYATTQDTTLSISITFLDEHRVRVAGVDAEDRQGPYSLPSLIYAPADNMPGPPGQPVVQ